MHFKIAMKKPLERMFMIWTQKRNETKATNSSFEFTYNDKVLSPADLAENVRSTRRLLSLMQADQALNSPNKEF